MPLRLNGSAVEHFELRKIAVVGPGIVGMPMAALLAHARIREGSDEPAKVVVIQRNSPTSGWKVDCNGLFSGGLIRAQWRAGGALG